ncbi:MAG: hypothetical protein K6A72_10410 [Lachnospiraceae bacterium]|nr:hypothetical protein [Lachnospiraceae bacterium]
MDSEELIREINTSIIRWYPFSDETSCIYIGEEDAVYSYLKEKFYSRVCRYILPENKGDSFDFELKEGKEKSKADYVISISYPELLNDPTALFAWAKEHLAFDGRLILGMNNRLGIKYFCGDCDPHTLQGFDGIDDYFRAYKNPEDKFVGRSYDKNQISHMLGKAGFDDAKYYSVFSDLDNASFLFADGYVPNEELGIRIYPTYNRPDTVFLEEEMLYSSLLDNRMFHAMANGFLIECTLDGKHSDALQVTSSLDRGIKMPGSLSFMRMTR